MYNLDQDLGEMNDLSIQDSLNFNYLKDELIHWETTISDPFWGEEREWMDVTHHIHQRLMENKKVLYKSPADRNSLKSTQESQSYD